MRMFPLSYRLIFFGCLLVLMALFGVGGMSPNRRGGGLAMLGVVIVFGLILLASVVWLRSGQKRDEQARIGAARTVIREQLDAVASDILKLEEEVRTAGNDEALTHYRSANATYSTAFREFDTADTAAELTDLAARLDVAIWQLDTTEALLDGSPPPPKPSIEPAAVSAPRRPTYQRRAGRSSCMGVSGLITGLLEGAATGGTTGSGSFRRMGPMGMMGSSRWQIAEPDERALEILRRRYAAGELTDEEFDGMRRILEGRET